MRENKNTISFTIAVALTAVLTICYIFLFLLPDLRIMAPEMLGITALITICLAASVYFGEKRQVFRSPVFILVLAAFFRLLFVFQPAQLSDDIYRYRFDATRLLSGINPYAESPATAASKNRDAEMLAADVNHPQLVTIYPPAAQFIFAAGALLGGIGGIKLLLAGLDLACIFLMMRLMHLLQIPIQRSVLYAWNPLPVLEIASSGHIDGAGLMFVFGALCLLIPGTSKTAFLPIKRSIARGTIHHIFMRTPVFFSGLLFSWALLTKLFPVVYLPFFLLVAGKNRIKPFFAGFALGGVSLVLPFCPDIGNSLSSLGLYAASWEFSGLLFRTLRRLLVSGTSARVILGSAFILLWFHGYQKSRRSIKGTMPTGDNILTLLKACHLTGFAFLLCTPTLHPWYCIYPLVFLPFSPGAVGLILSWSVTLGYRVLIPYSLLNQWIETDMVPLMIWSGPALAFLLVKHRSASRL